MCELDTFVYTFWGAFGALGSYLIYRKVKLKFQIGEKPITVDEQGSSELAKKD